MKSVIFFCAILCALFTACKEQQSSSVEMTEEQIRAAALASAETLEDTLKALDFPTLRDAAAGAPEFQIKVLRDLPLPEGDLEPFACFSTVKDGVVKSTMADEAPAAQYICTILLVSNDGHELRVYNYGSEGSRLLASEFIVYGKSQGIAVDRCSFGRISFEHMQM